jgi:hypothetical protein
MLDRIPKPVLIGAVAVIVVLALVIVFKSVKSAGGAGDYDAAEIKRLANERAKQPNGGRTMPTSIPGSGGYPGSGGR